MSDTGTCLTMHQPWASLLIKGLKIHEGRVWPTNHRGRLWIHSSSRHADQETLDDVLKDHPEGKDLDWPISSLLGFVTVDDCLNQVQLQPDNEITVKIYSRKITERNIQMERARLRTSSSAPIQSNSTSNCKCPEITSSGNFQKIFKRLRALSSDSRLYFYAPKTLTSSINSILSKTSRILYHENIFLTFKSFQKMLKRLLVNQTKLVFRAKTTSARPPINPKGKFDDKTEADLEAVKRMPASKKGKLYMEEAPIQKHPGGGKRP
jgi:hypothetical protein